MRITVFLSLVIAFSFGCQRETDKYPVQQADWENKTADNSQIIDYFHKKTYLPVYSHIYHMREHRTYDLTITVSIRNVSMTDTLYLDQADYYNTIGNKIREYIKKPIYVLPLETIEIVIEDRDIEGGSGANFVFEWAMKNKKNPPLFEAVMISTYGDQGLSFTTRGIPVVD